MENNKHIGSNFDDFLEEEGMLANVEAATHAVESLTPLEIGSREQYVFIIGRETKRRKEKERAL
ncbi:MAG: hypothetical protein Q8O92_00730 [Candidatus Latescibacter sp.]|nr:hypothetical protein [Candidatus Latescibacter sp.]